MLGLVYGSFTDACRRHRKELEFRMYRLGQKWGTEVTLLDFPCLPVLARSLSKALLSQDSLLCPVKRTGLSSFLK